MNHIIITGPTGAIGMALINKCIKEKTYVTAICHKGSSRIDRIPKSEYVNVIECNLDEIKQLPSLIKNDELCYKGSQYDAFIHLAWACTFGDSRNNIEAQINNIQYTIDSVEVAAELGCKKFIGAGSQAEYGRTNETLSPDTPCFPENGYGIAKLAAGNLSRIRADQLGIEHIWTRILSVYGPHDGENTLITTLIRKLKAGEHASCTEGIQIWDYLYEDDAADIFYGLVNKGVSGKTYVIASGLSRPLKDFIYDICDIVGSKTRELIKLGELPYGDKTVMHLDANIDALEKDINFEAKVTFADGIKKMI